MRWVEDKNKFDEVFLEARTCVYTDSGRLPTALKRLTFDDAGICTLRFADLLQKLMEWSGDDRCSYLVLEPDPAYYFHRLFGRYPVVEVKKGISSSEYLALLNEGPPGSPVDSVGTIWYACVIVPPSMRWFMHALRSDLDNGGHLWVPADWIDRIVGEFSFMTVGEVAEYDG